MTSRIDVPRRLRRAILLNDLSLVKRIIHNNPRYLRNPEIQDKSDTSLHLAAKSGFLAIAEYLIDNGHEDGGISRNNDWDTPLMLAAAAGHAEVGILLTERFPECIPWRNRTGQDALMLSSRSGTLPLLPILLTTCPNIITTVDIDGNTALHHASAAGELKALRLLLQFGANAMAENALAWTPVHYSATPAAEVYFKSLIVEIEKRKAEEIREARLRQAGGVRLVTNEEAMGRMAMAAGMGMGTGNAGGGRQRARDDAAIAGLPAPGMDWSPVQQRRAMTPTENRHVGWFGDGNRPRAISGD